MPLEFFPDRSAALPPNAEPLIQEQATTFQGVPRAIVTAPPRAALKAAETAHILATGIEPGLSPEERDAQFKRVEQTYKPYIDALSPKPYDTGTAGMILGNFLETLSTLATRGGAKALVAAPALEQGTELVRGGVDAGTAAGGVGILGMANAVGFKIPFLGKTLATRVLSGIGGNVAIGAGTDAWMHSLLDSGGYGELAKNYDPLNGSARILDAMLGGAFGGLHHHLEGGIRLDSGVADAVLALNRTRQAMRDSLPGQPKTFADLQAHTEALDTATRQMSEGLAVDVAGKLIGRNFEDSKFLNAERDRISRLANDVRDRALSDSGFIESDIPRAGRLSALDRGVESRFASYLVGHFDAAARRYNLIPATDGGRILNTDEVRGLSVDYAKDRDSAALLADAVHEPASWFTKQLYRAKLAEPLKAGQDPVVAFSGGGTGAGKTVAITSTYKDLTARAKLIYDSNANNFDSTANRIQQARDAGNEVAFIYVARDPVESFTQGALTRAMNPKNVGRAVSVPVHAATHRESAAVLRRLIEHFKDDPKVVFSVVDNTHGSGNAREGTPATLAKFDYTNLEKRLYAALEQEYQAGRINNTVYRASKGLGAAVRGQVPAGGDRAAQQSDQAARRKETWPVAPDQIKVPDFPDITKALESSAAMGLGHVTTVTTERGSRIGVRYALIEADKLRTSHTNELTPAKNFDARLQPRERDRAASEAQVARIEAKLDFNRVADNPTAADGAPILGPDDQVESGNARSIAIRRAYEHGTGDAYKRALQDRAADLGIDPQTVALMRHPVLVRQRISSVPDRAAFAIEANEQAQARMSLTEQARADASRLASLDGLSMNDDGSINMRESAGFLRRFVGDVSPSDQGAMMRPDGTLSTEGTARVRNALFARAYGDPELVSMLLEGTDQNVRNIMAGLSRAAGDMADVREGARDGYYHPLDISNDVAAAARLYAEVKQSGSSVDDYLANQVLFEPIPQLQQELLKAFDLHARSGRRVGEMLSQYADLVRAQGNPAQSVLVPEAGTGLSRESLLAEAAKALAPDQTRSTETGKEAPIAKAVRPDETVEGKQAAEVVATNPDVMVAYDEDSILSGAEAMAQADAEVAVAQHAATLFDRIAADITPQTLNVAEGGADYLAQPRARFNPDQITLDFAQDQPATPAAAAAGSVASVEQLARQPNELARRIAKEFDNAKSAALLGQKVGDVHDLAVLAQVYRNPQFETLRYLFVQKGQIVHATGVSSRMVGESQAFADKGGIDSVATLRATLDRLGPDAKFYMVHNHPSGNAEASPADLSMTRRLSDETGGRMLGHVIVNHKAYSTIDALGTGMTHPIENVDLHTRPIDHPVIGTRIESQSALVGVAHSMRDLTRGDSFLLIGRMPNGEVSGVIEIPNEWLNQNKLRLVAEARRYQLNSGARDLFAVGDLSLQRMPIMRQAHASGVLLDVIDWEGTRGLHSSVGPAAEHMVGGRDVGDLPVRAMEVKDKGTAYKGAEATPGDELTAGQVEHMRGLVREKLRYLQSVKLRALDEKLNAMSDGELAREASRRAAEDLVNEALDKKRRVALSIVAADRNAQIQDAHTEGKMRGLVSMMVRDKADVANSQSFESRERAIRDWASARLMPALEATNPHLFGLVEDKEGWRNLVREIYGEDTGNKQARDGAKAWVSVVDELRQRANFAGFNIAKLMSYALPQSHSRAALREAGLEQWIADILPKLDRQRYVNEHGALFSDREMEDFLGHAYENIVTNGMNNLAPGAYRGNSALVNKYQEHRAIHFKRADDYVDYLSRYGDEGSVHGVITGHVSRMARDIALVETFGPNPDKAFQVMLDRATLAGERDKVNFAENVYHEISGASSPGEVANWAEWSQGVRNLLVSTKLGGAAISSITDNATLHITAQLNNLSSMQVLRNQLEAFNPLTKADRDIARANGLGLDIFTQSLNRWGEEGLGGNMSGKLAAGTLRLSGLQAATEANKRAFGVTMMGAIGRLVRERDFAALHESDNRILASKGITAIDWAVWKKAALEDWGNGNDTMLSPQSLARIPDAALAGIDDRQPPAVLRNEAITKLLGAVLEETDNAVITTGYRERALLRQGTVRGTAAGELARHITLFKSYPVAMITKHWTRALSMPTMTGKVAYVGALFGALTILGAVAMTIKDIARGQDPRSMKDPRAWLAAMAQGGGLGIYGDYLFSDQSRYGNSLVASLAGPAAGTAEDLYKLSVGNIHQAIRGENTHVGAEALRFAKGNTPLVNLWYTKGALDRFILNDLQEYISPGYLARIREQTHQNTGTDAWWAPGEHRPERAPDMGALLASP